MDTVLTHALTEKYNSSGTEWIMWHIYSMQELCWATETAVAN
jgi:hypothetical protein